MPELKIVALLLSEDNRALFNVVVLKNQSLVELSVLYVWTASHHALTFPFHTKCHFFKLTSVLIFQLNRNFVRRFAFAQVAQIVFVFLSSLLLLFLLRGRRFEHAARFQALRLLWRRPRRDGITRALCYCLKSLRGVLIIWGWVLKCISRVSIEINL